MRYKEFVAVLIMCFVIGCGNNESPISSSNNSAPIIQAVTFIPDTVVLGRSCLVTVDAVDPDGDQIIYEWESIGVISGAGDGASVWYTPNACCANPLIMIHIKDGRGGSKDSTVIVQTKG